jgi:hypothetical protein
MLTRRCSLLGKDMKTFIQYYVNQQLIQEAAIDKLQTALDIVGFEPTVGTIADATNAIISGLRAALSKEKDLRKKHLINMGISATSLIPFADVIKILKLRKLGKKPAKIAISGARAIKSSAEMKKTQGNRFSEEEANI